MFLELPGRFWGRKGILGLITIPTFSTCGKLDKRFLALSAVAPLTWSVKLTVSIFGRRLALIFKSAEISLFCSTTIFFAVTLKLSLLNCVCPELKIELANFTRSELS